MISGTGSVVYYQEKLDSASLTLLLYYLLYIYINQYGSEYKYHMAILSNAKIVFKSGSEPFCAASY